MHASMFIHTPQSWMGGTWHRHGEDGCYPACMHAWMHACMHPCMHAWCRTCDVHNFHHAWWQWYRLIYQCICHAGYESCDVRPSLLCWLLRDIICVMHIYTACKWTRLQYHMAYSANSTNDYTFWKSWRLSNCIKSVGLVQVPVEYNIKVWRI